MREMISMPPIEFNVTTTTHRLAALSKRYLRTSSSELAPPPRRNLYGQSSQWNDPTIWKLLQHTEPRPAEVFVEEGCRELVAKLLSITKSVSGAANPSYLLRFVAAVAGRHLDILAQLESMKRAVFDAGLAHTVGTSISHKRPLKDHVLHAGCVLDAAVGLLDQPAYDGTKLFLKLFNAMERAYDGVFTNSPAAESNPLSDITSDEDRKAFVTDCCVGAVLAHDNGYLPMFELHLQDARVGHLIGFLRQEASQSAREQLAGWLMRIEHAVSGRLARQGADGAAMPFLLPPFRNAWMTDKDLKVKPDRLHGSVSGYQLLDYFFCSTPGAWDCLAPTEQWMLLMIAGASIFHGTELPALCNPVLTPQDVVNRAAFQASLSRPDNPVRMALARDPEGVPASIDRDDDGALRDTLARLNKLIFENTLHRHPDFQELHDGDATDGMERWRVTHELQELLRGMDQDKGDHAKAWRIRLNRFILEATLEGLRPALDQALAQTWQFNPLGLYLYAVDAMQEWVRLTWETTHSVDVGPNEKPLQMTTASGPEPARLLNVHVGLQEVEGLKVIIGQAPIPKTVVEFFPRAGTNQTERIEIRYHQVEPSEKRFVTQYGSYDYRQITGDFQKERTIPAAMRLITGCERITCVVPDISLATLDNFIGELERTVCGAYGLQQLHELNVPSTGADRERRCRNIKHFLEHIDIHGASRYMAAACRNLQEQLRDTVGKGNPTLQGPVDLDTFLENLLKATSANFH
jgi:hypothetical protein